MILAPVWSHYETAVSSAQNDIKAVRTLKLFVQKSFFHKFFLFFQSKSWLWESTAALFRQSVGYVLTLNFSSGHIGI